MIHLYYGDGKGKTTAACGLAVRAAGSGMRVLFVQFFKNGKSSEIAVLEAVPNITVKIPETCFGRFKKLTDEQKRELSAVYAETLGEVIFEAGNYDLIVLDESVSTYGHGMFGQADLVGFLRAEGEKREIVLTGRNPAPELLDAADYATEMRKEKHPYDRGIHARRGIEF